MKFTIPLQTEVQAYIKEKKGWPDSFCKHYAEKFWNHYQASGWKLSNGNPIKDWKACFNAQWQQIKFKEDIELFNKTAPVTNGKVVKMEPGNEVERLDFFIDVYRKPGADIPFKEFGKWYDFMKANKLLKPMYQNEIDELMEVYEGDKGKCRCAVVQKTLMGYINNGLRVSDLLMVREKLNT